MNIEKEAALSTLRATSLERRTLTPQTEDGEIVLHCVRPKGCEGPWLVSHDIDWIVQALADMSDDPTLYDFLADGLSWPQEFTEWEFKDVVDEDVDARTDRRGVPVSLRLGVQDLQRSNEHVFKNNVPGVFDEPTDMGRLMMRLYKSGVRCR